MWHPRERSDLVAALRDAGPGLPTLCEGWRTEHLAAHVVLRESTVLTAAGIVLAPLAARTERETRHLGDTSVAPDAWTALLDRVAAGPARWHPLRRLGDGPQLAELFVHTEDVRRARDGVRTEPRVQEPGHADALWRAVRRTARVLLVRCPVPVVLRRTDGAHAAASTGGPHEEVAVRRGPAEAEPVVVAGAAGELLLWAFDRSRVARVEVTGPAGAVGRLGAFRAPAR